MDILSSPSQNELLEFFEKLHKKKLAKVTRGNQGWHSRDGRRKRLTRLI